LAADDAAEQFREKFRLDELTVHESADWTVSVRPGQPVLGALVISTRHGATSFTDAQAADRGAAMLTLMARAEAAAQDRFGAVRLNALCLMMQDPLFHFHLLPRYGAPTEFARRSWTDSGWPGPPTLADNQAGPAELDALVAAYRAVDWA
jgi:diadenosine tetraphosphate (Ap4A) HIT family hydrolase